MSEDFKSNLMSKVSAQLNRVDAQSQKFMDGEITTDALNASAFAGVATSTLARVAFDIAR